MFLLVKKQKRKARQTMFLQHHFFATTVEAEVEAGFETDDKAGVGTEVEAEVEARVERNTAC